MLVLEPELELCIKCRLYLG